MRIFLYLALLLGAVCMLMYSRTVEPKAASLVSALNVAVVSDVHVHPDEPVSIKKFSAALKDLFSAAPKADALVVVGDLTVHGTAREYEAFYKIIKTNPHPKRVFVTVGNHEYHAVYIDPHTGKTNGKGFPNGETEHMSRARFMKYSGYRHVYEEAWVNGYHFLFLGSERYRQSSASNGEDAYLSDAQLKWLSLELKENASRTKPVFVFLHQPLPNTVAGTKAKRNTRPVIQHAALNRLLSQYPQVIFFNGHTHWQLAITGSFLRGAFTMVDTSSVRQPFTMKDGPAASSASEGLIIQAKGSTVTIKGRDFYRKSWIKGVNYIVETGSR